MEDPLIGTTLGPYVLGRVIGRGGMGQVFRARQVALGRDVAVKVLAAGPSTDAADVERFRREALAMSRVQHPNVVRVLDSGAEGERLWLAMELLDGASLRERFEERAPVLEAVTIARDLCLGLAAVHEAGLVHRDVKLANVMLTRDGTVKLMDLGLARDPKVTRLTEAGELVGTPAYLAPEAIRGEPGDHRVDVYQAGLVLYFLLAGRLPHEADSLPVYVEMVCTRPAPPPGGFVPGIPPRLDALAVSAVAADPAGRPASASAMADALEGVLVDASRAGQKRPVRRRSGATSTPVARPSASVPVPASHGGRRLLGLVSGLAALFALAGAWLARPAPRAADVRDLAIEPGLRRATITFSCAVEPRATVTPSTYAFTEQGVGMLLSVLRGEQAIVVNIEIMRTDHRPGEPSGAGQAA